MNNKQLYEKLINNIAKVVKQQLNESFYDKDDHSRYFKQPVHDRIAQHYIDDGYKSRVVSKLTQNAHKVSDPVAALYNADLNKNVKKSPADIQIWGSNLPYASKDNYNIFIALQQRSQSNPGTFRVELNKTLTDLADNNNPTKYVTYIAFIDKNLVDTTEMDIYVVPLEIILDVAHDITENGHKLPKKNKIIDNFGNWLTLNKTGKNTGLVLKDNWIKNNCVDSFHLDSTPKVVSSYMG